MKKCETCANAKLFKGAYDDATYIECGLKPNAKNLSKEELIDRVLNPQKYTNECKYEKGTPKDCGVTYDD